jgi:hypothetical protein
MKVDIRKPGATKTIEALFKKPEREMSEKHRYLKEDVLDLIP